MTNREKFKEIFGFDGSIVNRIPPDEAHQVGSCGYLCECKESCASMYYPRCPKWWENEFLGVT